MTHLQVLEIFLYLISKNQFKYFFSAFPLPSYSQNKKLNEQNSFYSNLSV